MTTPTLRVAALQISSQDDVSANLGVCRELIQRATERGAKVSLLPENFAFFGKEEDKCRLAERLGDLDAPIQRMLSDTARSSGTTIIAGGMPEQSPDPERPYNTCAVFAPDGNIAASYRKIHLFDVDLADGSTLRESSATLPGDADGPVVVDISGFRVGLSICYDIRFPELYRKLSALGAEILVVPAAFTLHTGRDHWHVLLRARAIESQAFVVAAAQWGKHPKGRTTYGHSLIVDPWGTVVADASDRVGFVIADLDRELLEKVRTALPSLSHRKI